VSSNPNLKLRALQSNKRLLRHWLLPTTESVIALTYDSIGLRSANVPARLLILFEGPILRAILTTIVSTSPVLVGTAVCLLFYLSVGAVTEAADNHAKLASQPLDIHVQSNAFGRASTSDVAAVLQSAGNEIWRHCPRSRLGGIDVYRRADHPQTDFQRAPDGRISIGLSSQDTYWAQYSFQFAHEFCHALANFSDNPRRSVRFPRTANLWLEESLSETASLFTLRAMSRSWRSAPPYPPWRDYASSYDDYVEKRLALRENHLPAGMPFLVWFRENEDALRQNPAMRDRNTVVATQLLPLFNAEPNGWEALTFLNRGTLDANQSLAQHLAEWRSQCPSDLRRFVSKLAGVFAVKI
jgi:hypothetical protein